MLFNSIEYLFAFLPVVFIGYFLLNKIKLYNLAKLYLLLASLFFYGSYKWEYVCIIVTSILLNYVVNYLIQHCNNNYIKKLILISGIIANVLILVFFKYFNYVAQLLTNLNIGNFNLIEIIIPIGINFFTLQQISYIIDSYNKKFTNYNFLDYSLYICFFPQLLAGPIVRHQEMIPQFNNLKNKKINQANIFIAIFLITVGLFKKTVFSDGYASFIDYVSNSSLYTNFYTAWLLGITKMFRLYFDFSGYCDIALGSAFLFNISLPWNFNSPFQVNCIIDYWKKWNMTLIRFLKDYIYKPLGADKKSLLRTQLNILITFSIMGIWIGVNTVSILSGIISGIFVSINYLWQKLNIKINKYFSKILMFTCFSVIGQFTYSNDITTVMNPLKTMFGINANFGHLIIQGYNFIFYPQPSIFVKLNIPLLIISFMVLYFCKNSNELSKIFVKANNSFYTVILGIMFVIAVIFLTKTSDFVYFIF